MPDELLDRGEIQPKPLDPAIIKQLDTYAGTELVDKQDTLNPKQKILLEKLEKSGSVKALLPPLLTVLQKNNYILLPEDKQVDLVTSFPTEFLLNRLYFYEGFTQGQNLTKRLETFDNALGKLAEELSRELHDAAPINKRGGVLKHWGSLIAADKLKIVLQVIFTPKRYDIIDAYYQADQFYHSASKPEVTTPERISFTSEEKRDIEVALGLLQNRLSDLEQQVKNLTAAKANHAYNERKLKEITMKISDITTQISNIKNDPKIYDSTKNKFIPPVEQSTTRTAYSKWMETARNFYHPGKK